MQSVTKAQDSPYGIIPQPGRGGVFRKQGNDRRNVVVPNRMLDAPDRVNNAFIILSVSAIILLTYLIVSTFALPSEPAFRENQAKAKGWRVKWKINPPKASSNIRHYNAKSSLFLYRLRSS